MGNMSCAILGSGFGLYGYLPAMVQKGHRILLPQRYRAVFESRPELAQFAPKVQFVQDEQTALANAEICVIAKRPQDQAYWVEQILQSRSVRYAILEKPLAPTPQDARDLLQKFCNSGVDVRIGYSFLYTEWGKAVASLLEQDAGAFIPVYWEFEAHHFKNDLDTWKRFDAQGGGALRFYGIQLIALLATCTAWNIKRSVLYCTAPGETCRWEAEIKCGNGPTVKILVDSNAAQTRFTVGRLRLGQDDETVYNAASPFEAGLPGQDARVAILCDLIDSFADGSRPCALYERSIRLWDEIEQKSKVLCTER